jgi:hypothetical protein
MLLPFFCFSNNTKSNMQYSTSIGRSIGTPKEEDPPNVPQDGLQQQLSSEKCKVLDGRGQKRAEVH